MTAPAHNSPVRSATHHTFVIERVIAAAPARVYAAFADKAAKARWFADVEGWETLENRLDFRVGGAERVSSRIVAGEGAGGPPHVFEGRYHDIVPEQRIVYSYDMYLGETRISTSLTTIELQPEGSGTRLVFTEQDVFLDGHDIPSQREEGTKWLLGNLAAAVESDANRAA